MKNKKEITKRVLKNQTCETCKYCMNLKDSKICIKGDSWKVIISNKIPKIKTCKNWCIQLKDLDKNLYNHLTRSSWEESIKRIIDSE